MNLIEYIKTKISERQKSTKRNIPDNYFNGYRRLASKTEDVVGQHCYNCKNAVGFVTWHCDQSECKWESCYVATELTLADLKAGQKLVGGWLGLPPRE